MKYSFTIVFKPYTRTSGCLEDISRICNGRTCLVAKNNKIGGLYLHKKAKIVKGNFAKAAGSHNYPILFPRQEVHIQVTDFDFPPNIITNQKLDTGSISIINPLKSDRPE